MKKILIALMVSVLGVSYAVERQASKHEATAIPPSATTHGLVVGTTTLATETRTPGERGPLPPHAPSPTTTATLTLNVETIVVSPRTHPTSSPTTTAGTPPETTPTRILIGTMKKDGTPTSTPPPTNPPVPTPAEISSLKPVTPTTDLTWGVFAGSNPTAIADFEKRVEASPDYLAYFVHWANGGGKLPTWLKTYAGDKERTLIIFWEASDFTVGGTDQPEYAYRTILRGDHDAYIRDFARQLKSYADPIILVPFSELNGNWTPWSGTKNGNTPLEAVEAFRYVHGFFDVAPNVKFGLALNAASVPNTPENAHSAYYPGDEYVDYVGLDGFNMGDPWLSFDQIFGAGLKALLPYKKPLFIFSFGSAEGDEKAAWLSDAFTRMSSYPTMKGFIYFNQNKERNWLLWSDTASLATFEDFVGTLE
jgi:beta-mannanase